MTTNIVADIEGIINELNIGEEDVLFPIFEGVVNSIQSIEEAGCANGYIRIVVKRDHTQESLFRDFSNYPISEITIEDNGVGFNEVNFKSYCTAHSTKKIKLGGKGVGRFTMLAVFDSILIESITNGIKNNKISFTLERNHGLSAPIYETVIDVPRTIIHLTKVNKKYSNTVAKYNDEEIVKNILSHCLMYYINNKAPNIEYVDDNNNTIKLNNIFKPSYIIDHQDYFMLCNKRFDVYHVKELNAKSHEICLYGNNRMVKSKRLDKVLPIFSSAINFNEESYYLKTHIVSEYLDTIVKTGRNEFNFPKEKIDEDEMEDFGFIKDTDTLSETSIMCNVIKSIKKLYPEEFIKREKIVRQIIDSYLNTDEGLEFRHLQFPNEFYYGIKDSSTTPQLYKALLKYKYHKSCENQKKCIKLMKREYSNKGEYQDLLKEYVSFATQENSSSLAKYVAHRRTIIELLSRYLQWSEKEKNYEEEAALHNLFFTMGKDNLNTSYDEHNLWLLDDRLAFHRFIYSDKQIRLHKPNSGNSECLKETDIAIYDIPYGYDEEDDFGNIQSIVIFELKRPNRLLTVSEYKKQMKEQVMGIREGRKRKNNGTNIFMKDNTPIFFYYVVDINAYNLLKNELIEYEHFKETPYNSLVHMNDTLHEEILTYQAILVNSKRRNKIFFDKLGVKY